MQRNSNLIHLFRIWTDSSWCVIATNVIIDSKQDGWWCLAVHNRISHDTGVVRVVVPTMPNRRIPLKHQPSTRIPHQMICRWSANRSASCAMMSFIRVSVQYRMVYRLNFSFIWSHCTVTFHSKSVWLALKLKANVMIK